MEKVHSRINWENYPSIATPLNEANLNKMDKALDEVDNRVLGLDTAKLDKSTANTMVKDVTFDESTGIFTVTLLNGTAKTINTKLEKVVTNFRYDNQSQKLVLTLADGSEQQVDLSSLISNYEFADGNIITFIIGSDGKVTANVKDGSITETKLQPNFLANVKTEVSKAKSYADSSYENATTSRNAVTEAKQYRDEALQFRNEAESFAPEGYADLVEQVNENTVKVDTIIAKADLGIKETATGEEIHLIDSAEGKAVEFALYGKAKQNTTQGNQLFDSSYRTNGEIYSRNCTVTEKDGVFTLEVTAADSFFWEVRPAGNPYLNNACGPLIEKTEDLTQLYVNISNEAFKRNFVTFYDENKVSIGYNIYYTNAFNINGDKLNNAKYFSLRFGLGNSEASGKYETTVMINKGSEPLPWEEFTDGMASPNPQYPQPIEVSGESYNLLDCRVLTEQTINNGTFTPIYDENGNLECVNVNGTFSANATYVLQTNPKLSSGELIMSGCPSGGSENTFFLQYSNNVDFAYPDIGNGVKIEKMDSSKYPNIEVKIQIRSGYTANSLKFYPMIRKASVKNDRYMPYGVDSVEVKSVGKNLFDVNGTKTAGAVSNIVVDSDTSSVTGYCSGAMFSYVKFALDSKKFIGKQLKTTWKNGNTKQYRVRFMYKINGQNNISDTVNVTEKIEELSLHLGFNESGTAVEPFTFTFENIQIEYYGTVASVFEPYKETLSAIPTENGLASVDDIRDVIVKYADGSGDKIQRVGKEVFDGSIDENWSIRPTDKTNIYRIETTILNKKIKLPTTNAIIGKIICSHCIPVSAENTWLAKNGISVETSGNIFVYDEGYNTNDLTLWTSYLSENPMTLYYELATPIVTPLTAEEIAEIEKLHTFYPITNISNDFDCGMKITYNCDSKNYIDNKIALLTTAMINNI